MSIEVTENSTKVYLHRNEATSLTGVRKITLDPFVDHRGEYIEIYNAQLYKEAGIDINFCQDDISISKKNVFKGIHGDNKTWKLITCLCGEFYLVVVDCNRESPKFGFWCGFLMHERKNYQVLIPPGYGNGHLALSGRTVFHYKQSTYYKGSASQFTYNIKDPFFNIKLPADDDDLILSGRDMEAKFVTL